MSSYRNEYFDVNILDDAFTTPDIKLSKPLPFEDKSTYIPLPDNEPPEIQWKIFNNFIGWITGINYNDIYANNEFYYSMNKHTGKFNQKLNEFMDDKLEHSDEKLDQLVFDLIDKELNLNLIKSKDLPKRFQAVKSFMIKYYKAENEKNLPQFRTSNFIRLCYVTVIKLLSNMFPDGIWCNRDQFTTLYYDYLKDPMSLIFLPCHKSHVDYIIFHIFSVRFQLAVPTVVAGENLNVAIFGRILKGLGAIFIKRSFNNELYTEQNLTNLFEFLILNKVNIEVFIEGTRSRDGKLLLPKYGILKMLASVYEKSHQDMRFQPLSIAYERIYETDGYLNELLGKDKKQENFMSIISNGVDNLLGRSENLPVDTIIKKKASYDNTNRKLSGRIFVKLGKSFTLSDFIKYECSNNVINLKKLGFKILHEVNYTNYLPPISIIGTVLQLYLYNKPGTKSIKISDLKQYWHIILSIFEDELDDDINLSLLKYFNQLPMEEFDYIVKYQIIKFFKFIKIDFKEDCIKIINSIELLYYKNLTIHLLIYKSLVSFIIINSNIKLYDNYQKIFTIFKNFLKNEFLFDYDFNEKHLFKNLINKLKVDGKINDKIEIVDREYLTVLSSFVKPFIQSYMISIQNINIIMNQYYSDHPPINDHLLINNDDLNHDFPDTKKLLKLIQKNSNAEFEAINKQYLLSGLFYLNHLNLIKIFKNKSKTKAFVQVENEKDLNIILMFLNSFVSNDKKFQNSVNINYVADIVNKKPRTIKL